MSRSFTHVEYPEPHVERSTRIMAAYPQVKTLFGNTPTSLIYIIAMILVQFSLAIFLSNKSFWLILLVSYIVGAILNHNMFVMIHEATHNLVLKGNTANRLVGVIANLPVVFPMAMGFRSYHLLHHRFQGDPERDADIPGPKEAQWVGNSPIRKAVWLLFFFFIEGVVRPIRVKKVNLFDKWGILNALIVLGTQATLIYFFGWGAFVYLALSTFFSIGLHPVGARWIQEHYIIKPGQETYSYYGPLNKVSFYIGYHNEHHDFMGIPWSRLPKLKAMAPEFYDNLYSHQSWSKLLFKFLFDRNLDLYSRVTRSTKTNKTATVKSDAVLFEPTV